MVGPTVIKLIVAKIFEVITDLPELILVLLEIDMLTIIKE